MKTLLIGSAVIALLLGTVGAGAAAAQASEAGGPLYMLRTWVERTRLQAHVETQIRSQEQMRLQQATGTPTPLPEPIKDRDQDRAQDQDRVQERDQDRIHQSDPTAPQNNGDGLGPNPGHGGNGRP